VLIVPQGNFDEHVGGTDVVYLRCVDLGRRWTEWRKSASLHWLLVIPGIPRRRPCHPVFGRAHRRGVAAALVAVVAAVMAVAAPG
jgi:hypothetical protein